MLGGQMKKVADHGSSHPAVARLAIGMFEILSSTRLDTAHV